MLRFFCFTIDGFCFVEEAKVTHMDLNWTVDFVSQKLMGSVTLIVERVDPEAAYLVSPRFFTHQRMATSCPIF